LTLWHRGEIDEAVPKACMTIGFISIFVIAEFGFEFSISALIGGLMCGFAGGLALSPSVETGETATTPKLIWTAALAALLLGAVGEWSKASNHGLRGTLEVLDAAEALDRRVATQLQKARSDWQSCRSEPADVAAMIQKDILPDVHSVRTRLEQLAPYPGSIAADATKELDVMKRRETDLDARVPTAKWSPDAGSARQRGECS
jgi:hypothetical protein